MLTVENVSFSFGKLKALDQINLRLEQGTYALLGPNGAGKTTLIRCITGMYEFAGKILFADGQKKVGYLPQSLGFFKALTVEEMLQYFCCLKKIPKDQMDGEIDRCLQVTNLEDKHREKTGALSGGMRRRLGVAQAILGRPSVLIFDEPTAGLDPEERMRFKNLVYELNREKEMTILISTHIVDDVVGSCDRIVILREGKILTNEEEWSIRKQAEGKVFETVNTHREIPGVYVEKNMERDNIEYIRVLSAEAHAGFTSVTPTLEDGYMCMIKGF